MFQTENVCLNLVRHSFSNVQDAIEEAEDATCQACQKYHSLAAASIQYCTIVSFSADILLFQYDKPDSYRIIFSRLFDCYTIKKHNINPSSSHQVSVFEWFILLFLYFQWTVYMQLSTRKVIFAVLT